MAFTYLILNIVFMSCAILLSVKAFASPSRVWWTTLITLVILTIIFDNLIIGAGIVGYDTTKLLGIFIGYAPIEDFFYALLACIVVPAFWKQFAPEKEKSSRK